MTLRRGTALSCLVCAWAPATVAAGQVFTEQDLFGEIPRVSVVSRFEQDLAQAPAGVTVIDRELIEMSGAQTFVDIFRLVPGFQSYHVGNNRYGISYHGIGLENIDHIEVVRGSNAPTQGSNAFMGPINIVTRKPVQDERTSLSATARDTQSRRLVLVHSQRMAEADVRLSQGYDSNEGFPAVASGSLEDSHELTYGPGVRPARLRFGSRRQPGRGPADCPESGRSLFGVQRQQSFRNPLLFKCSTGHSLMTNAV